MLNDTAAELRRAFQESGLTMTAFRKAVMADSGRVRGSSESSLRDYLHGRVANPRSEILVAMARVLGVKEEFVLHGTGDPTPAETVVREAAGKQLLWVDDDRGWRDEAVTEIKKSSMLANSPTTVVRTGFFDLLMRVVASPASDLEDTEATAEMASVLDDLIQRPIDMFYPREAPPMSAEPVRSYLTGILHSLTLLVPRDDEGGKFGLPWKPAIDGGYILDTFIAAADRWSIKVPFGEGQAMVHLGDLDTDGIRELAKQCRDLSEALNSASWRLGKAAEGMDPSECARDSKALAGELPLLSRIAPALSGGAEEEVRAGAVRAERKRVWAAFEEMIENLPVEEKRRAWAVLKRIAGDLSVEDFKELMDEGADPDETTQ